MLSSQRSERIAPAKKLPDCYFIISTNPRDPDKVFKDVRDIARRQGADLQRSRFYHDGQNRKAYVFIHFPGRYDLAFRTKSNNVARALQRAQSIRPTLLESSGIVGLGVAGEHPLAQHD